MLHKPCIKNIRHITSKCLQSIMLLENAKCSVMSIAWHQGSHQEIYFINSEKEIWGTWSCSSNIRPRMVHVTEINYRIYSNKRPTSNSQGLHSHILMTGGSNRGSYFIPKKNPNFRISLPKKNPYFFSIPKKIPQCFCISKFYYLSPEIIESATHPCMGSY